MISKLASKKILLINCGNIHSGGGLQVAVAFLSDFINYDDLRANFSVNVAKVLWLSSAVYKQLNVTLSDLESIFDIVKVVDLVGIAAVFRSPAVWRMKPDVVFTVFGPNYLLGGMYRVTGFAQPWIIYPSKSVYSKYSGFINKFKSFIKFEVQWLFFKREDLLVVELPHVKSALSSYRKFSSSKISIVPNALNPSILNTHAQLSETCDDNCVPTLEFGLVSRSYPHKNIDFAIKVIESLRQDYSLDARLHLTLTETEAAGLNLHNYPFVYNHGPITLDRLPFFYSQIEYVIFPTLLECFSATPLEAFYFGKTLFCSDLEFMKDCASDYAIYFNPYDVDAATMVVAKFLSITSEDELLSMAAKSKQYVLSLATSIDRTAAYIDVITNALSEEEFSP